MFKLSPISKTLYNKTIIFPIKGEYKTPFFYERLNSFWAILGVKKFKSENIMISKVDAINSIPSNSEKTCFYYYNLCTVSLKGEVFKNLYFIESPKKNYSIFTDETLLVSPKIFDILGKEPQQ